ncbi:MAG: type II secretion system F family protein [Actinomycetota bacterium]|nr:type II secretion system F family protein [Actinomycetota bacterium]
MLILTTIFGSLFGLGLFFVVRPGALTNRVVQSRNRLEHGMIWLILRAQTQHRADLAIVGYQASEMVSRKLATMFIASASALGLIVAFNASSLQVSKIFVLFILSTVAAIGFFLPDTQVRAKAKSRRQDFLHAFSSYLDLVNVLLAGGAGTETALTAAAEAGDGWSFSEIRNALTRARSSRRSPWVELATLGTTYNIAEISEVAGSVQLAGEHGARIRLSLSARADSLRNRHMGEIEAEAQSATERMGIPMVLLFVAFIALIGYPAVHLVLGSF